MFIPFNLEKRRVPYHKSLKRTFFVYSRDGAHPQLGIEENLTSFVLC